MFKGTKVNLRPYRKEDIDKALAYINDYEVGRLLTPGEYFPFTHEQETVFITKILTGDTKYQLAIETIKSEYIGGIGIKSIDWKNSVCLIGLFLGRKYWNKGYGAEAVKLLLEYIFNELNIRKVKLNVFEYNQRAIHVYDKIGFREEGRLREEIYRDGKYSDDIVMALFKNEYTSAPEKDKLQKRKRRARDNE